MSFSKSKAVSTKMQTILKLDLCKFSRGSSLLQIPTHKICRPQMTTHFLSGCGELNSVSLRPERSVIPIHYTPKNFIILQCTYCFSGWSSLYPDHNALAVMGARYKRKHRNQYFNNEYYWKGDEQALTLPTTNLLTPIFYS